MASGIQVTLIAIVFAAQILVLSFLTPWRRHRLHSAMFTKYPSQEYPRLYPVARERIQRRLALFRPMHPVIGAGAAITLAIGLIQGIGPLGLARWMLYCLLVQILPFYVAMPWTIKLIRAYRAMPPPSARSVELRQWRVVDFVSPLAIGLGLIGQGLALAAAVVAYLNRPQLLRLILFCVIISGALLARMLYLLFGHAALVRADPYMSAADTLRVRQRRFRTLFRGAAVLGAYFALMQLYGARLIHFDFIYLVIGISIAFQLLGIALVSAQGRDLETRDFSVYRADSSFVVSKLPVFRD